MQISLQEDDGIFHEGVPQIVVLVVKFDDGKVKRIPYPAEKTIAALYQDLAAIAPKVAEGPQQDIMKNIGGGFSGFEDGSGNLIPETPLPKDRPGIKKSPVDKSHIIEKEDIVTMVKMRERDKGSTCLLMVGMDYRVIQAIGQFHPVTQQRLVEGYDVIDDTAAMPERMRVFPDEVVLKRKRLSAIIPKTTFIEEILPCPSCQVANVLVLDGSDFKGKCEACGVDITIARVIRKCLTTKCDQEVSCFDVGGKYAGTCGKCKAKIEVPYA